MFSLQLDDNEFQLPPVSELPTLESILNEDQDEDDDEPGSVSDSETTQFVPAIIPKVHNPYTIICYYKLYFNILAKFFWRRRRDCISFI